MADLTPPPSQHNTPLRPSDNAEPGSPTLQTAATSTDPLATTLADANDGPAPSGMDVDEEARSVDEESGAQSDAELAAEAESDDGMIEEESDNDDKSGNDSDVAMAIEAERIRATEEKLAAYSDWNKDQEIESDTTSEGGSARKHRRHENSARYNREEAKRDKKEYMQRAALKKKDHLPEEDVLARWNQAIGDVCYSHDLRARVQDQIADAKYS